MNINPININPSCPDLRSLGAVYVKYVAGLGPGIEPGPGVFLEQRVFFFFFLQCRRILGALNNPSLLSSWAMERERAGASQK